MKIESGNKKWAIQQMLDGRIILNEWDAKFRYHTGKFQCFFEDRDQWVDIEINGVVSDKYRLCENLEKVELPEEVTIVIENKHLANGNELELSSALNQILERQNQIIKYLKAKEME